jgi:hypothetical protein
VCQGVPCRSEELISDSRSAADCLLLRTWSNEICHVTRIASLAASSRRRWPGPRFCCRSASTLRGTAAPSIVAPAVECMPLSAQERAACGGAPPPAQQHRCCCRCRFRSSCPCLLASCAAERVCSCVVHRLDRYDVAVFAACLVRLVTSMEPCLLGGRYLARWCWRARTLLLALPSLSNVTCDFWLSPRLRRENASIVRVVHHQQPIARSSRPAASRALA